MNHLNQKTILVTGGSGYIGSHACLVLLEYGYQVVVVDNLSNSSKDSLKRIEILSRKKIDFYPFDIRQTEKMRTVFENHTIDAVIHFAGLKSVAESVSKPLDYFDNNISGTINLLQVMNDFNVKKIIFSSSATVYSDKNSLPFKEEGLLKTINPYGTSKMLIETILQDQYNCDNNWEISILRYFNPVGAHSSGQIGENPNGIPNNLMPYISKVALKKLPELIVYGNNYDTIDGTGVRDYIHVMDLVEGHIKAMLSLKKLKPPLILNLGTGVGTSVLQMINAFEKASGVKVNYKFSARREGDIASGYANVDKAIKEINWKAVRELAEMCEDSWRWQVNNPNGY